MQITSEMVSFDATKVLQVARTEKARVELTLRSGAQLSGFVTEVGVHAIVLSELTGREFFDAMVFTGEIAAIATQVRGLPGSKRK
jgi:hypothetical protein